MVSTMLQSLWIYLKNSQYLIKIRGQLYVLLMILLIIDHAKAQWSVDSIMSKPLWLPDSAVAEIPAIYPTIHMKDPETALTTQAPDTFQFDDGTTQGWHLYKGDRAEYWICSDYYGYVPLGPVPPLLKYENSFNFDRSSGGALAVIFPSTAPQLPSGFPSGGFWWLFVDSPDLSENPNWQNINGFKAAIYNIDLPQDSMRVFARMFVIGQKADGSQARTYMYYNWVLNEKEQWQEIWVGPMNLSHYTKILGVALLLGTRDPELIGGLCIDYVAPIREVVPKYQWNTWTWCDILTIDNVTGSGKEMFCGNNPRGKGTLNKYLAYTYYDSLYGGNHWRIDPGGYIDFQCYKPEGALTGSMYWFVRGTPKGVDSTYLSLYVNDVMYWDGNKKVPNYQDYQGDWYIADQEILVDGLNHFKIGCADNSLSYLALQELWIFWWEPFSVSVQEEVTKYLPIDYFVSQNFPNPFNSFTQIQYNAPLACNVKISIFNISGQEICVIVDDKKNAGYHTVYWDGKDKNGREVVSGIYLYQFKVDNFVQTKKMTFIK